MNIEVFDDIVRVLHDKFQVDPVLLRPETTLESLGMDSLTLMEFVFAVEDRFSVRVPEEKLDPRQAGITLQHLSEVLEAEIVAPRAGTAQAA
jgi:acyl carrier protein